MKKWYLGTGEQIEKEEIQKNNDVCIKNAIEKNDMNELLNCKFVFSENFMNSLEECEIDSK